MTPVSDEAPDRSAEADPGAVAVVGLGLALPGANNTAEFWDRLREGVLLSSEPSAFDLKHFWAPTREETDAFYFARPDTSTTSCRTPPRSPNRTGT